MKKNRSLLGLWIFVLVIAAGGFVMPAFSMAPPINEEFLSETLPGGDEWFFTSSSEGRIGLVADTALLETADVPSGLWILADSQTSANRMRGNYYRCDETANLQKQTMYLGRSAPADILFSVYESSTEGGTYSLVGTSMVTAAVGTNLLSSGEMNVTLSAGKFYIIGAAWSDAVFYRWAQPQAVATSFGEQLSGYYLNGYPSGTTATGGSTSTTLYPQQLIFATNQVVRMDDSVDGSLYSTNSMDLRANLEGYTDVTLKFRHQAHGEEAHAADGIFFSDDLVNFTKVHTLSSGTTGWQDLTLDVDVLAAASGLALTSPFFIRFQQSDNYGAPSDGRDFDDIQLYSKPDLEASSVKSGGSTAIRKTWRGLNSNKYISLEFLVTSRAGISDFSDPSMGIRYQLKDSGGTVQDSQINNVAWNVDAMTVQTRTHYPLIVIPPATKLSDLNYTIHATIDPLNNVAEALENNNVKTMTVEVNHYSGSLWFNNVETSITITNWGTRVANSAIEHWISGTGILDGQGFSFTNLKVDKNQTTLDYSVDSTETTTITVPSPDRDQLNGVTFWRQGGIKLKYQGAFANIKVLLPAGLGMSSSSEKVLESTHTFPGRRLSPTLYPYTTATTSGNFYISEESKPLVYKVSAIGWRPGDGAFSFVKTDVAFVRENQMAHMEVEAGHFTNSVLKVKKSNAAYYRGVSGLSTNPFVETGPNGEALLSTELEIDETAIIAHFPYGVEQAWSNSSTFVISQDLVVGSALNYNTLGPDIAVSYARDCYPALECSGMLGADTFLCTVLNHSTVSMDGGLRTPIYIDGGRQLGWGTRWGDVVTHSASDFADGSIYIPGHFIRGDLSGFDATDQLGPAEILLSGMANKAIAPMERPSQPNYADGFADYAGLNLRVHDDGKVKGASTVGGTLAQGWPLTARSKYYARHSGVSGIHETVFGQFPSPTPVYGYNLDVSNFGHSFLSGKPKDSRFNGSVHLPQPSNITLEFEELMLDCLGELEEAELADNDSKTLEYWDADIQPLTLFFASTANSSCGSADRKLCMGLTTQCANVDQTLSGVLAFLPSGELGAPADQIVGVPSRLAVPNQIELAGPGNETYYFNPVAMPYYNDYSLRGYAAESRGWINFAGNLDVAFFSDLQVHFHTSASTNSAIANVYMMGGWEANAIQTFFNSDPDDFDTVNAGYPNGAVSEYLDYRSPGNNTYRTRAQRSWLGVVDFDYPLEWSFASKSFKSPDAEHVDLMVMNVEHQTDYLSADNAEISFGVQYDGLPQVNLANMAFNAVNDATGMSSAFGDAVGDAVRDTIDSGVSAMEDTLADVPEMLFDPIFEQVLDPLVEDFYEDLSDAYDAAPNSDYYSTVVTQYIYGIGINAVQYQDVSHILKKMADGTGMATDLVKEIDGNLEEVEALLNAFIGTVSETNNVSLPSPLPGLLDVNGGDYQTLTDLGSGLLSVLAETLYDSLSATIEDELNAILADAAPSLEAITDVMQDLQIVVVNVRTNLAEAGSLVQEIDGLLNSTALDDPLDDISSAIDQWFAALPSAGRAFDEYTEEEIKQMLRQQITDAFYGSVPCADVQQAVRAQLYEVDAAIQETIDSAFQQLNNAIRDLASEFLTGIDDSINAMLDDLSGIMGAGQIDGYAHIRHDSLAELRLDGKFQWEVPDEMEFNAYLIIKQLNSDNSGGCGVVGEVMPEVTLGTTGFGINWLDSDIKADIATKFTFRLDSEGDAELIGLGGSFEMVEGEIGFESFAIDEFYAAVALGLRENYISANLHCSFTSYEVEGGAFFGKACSLDPFSWDPDVQSVLGDPPFTGVYVYGEGWMPIVDFGCLFRIKAGVGAGIFAFVDGPVGGKIFLGADGEALCVVGVSGDVTLVGLKDGDDMRMTGKGRISGRVGSCPFCVKFGKTVTISYDNGSWDADY